MDDLALHKLGQDLDQEYLNTPAEKIAASIPWPVRPEDVDQIRQNKDKAAAHLKRDYYRSIAKIKELGLTITSIQKNISHYHDRHCYFGGCDTFIFDCEYAVWKVQVTFLDEYDPYPSDSYDEEENEKGDLRLHKIIHKETGKECVVSIGLHYPTDTFHKDVLTLLECTSFEDYVKKRFGSFLDLPSKLSERGFLASLSCPITPVSVNNCNDLDIYIDITTAKGTFHIFPCGWKRGDGFMDYASDYCLLLGTPYRKPYYLYDDEVPTGFHYKMYYMWDRSGTHTVDFEVPDFSKIDVDRLCAALSELINKFP